MTFGRHAFVVRDIDISDAAFVAASRSDVPELLDEVRGLQDEAEKEVLRLRGIVAKQADQIAKLKAAAP